jgi:hypothetical protein
MCPVSVYEGKTLYERKKSSSTSVEIFPVLFSTMEKTELPAEYSSILSNMVDLTKCLQPSCFLLTDELFRQQISSQETLHLVNRTRKSLFSSSSVSDFNIVFKRGDFVSKIHKA